MPYCNRHSFSTRFLLYTISKSINSQREGATYLHRGYVVVRLLLLISTLVGDLSRESCRLGGATFHNAKLLATHAWRCQHRTGSKIPRNVLPAVPPHPADTSPRPVPVQRAITKKRYHTDRGPGPTHKIAK